MANLGKIIYLSEAQKDELFTNGSVTSNGTTIEYNQNDLYITPDTNVEDVKVGGISVVSNNSANIPVASTTNFGVVGISTSFGIKVNEYGKLRTDGAGDAMIKAGENGYFPLTPLRQEKSVFYGLTKAAGVDMASSSNSVGTYTDAAKDAIQNMLGISDLISTRESSTATVAHAANSLFLMDGKLHKATSAIEIGDAVAAGTNCQIVKADEVFVKNTDYAQQNGNYGLIKLATIDYGIGVMTSGAYSGAIAIAPATTAVIKDGTTNFKPIVPHYQHTSVFYGLAKVAGVDLANETVTVGTYPATASAAIRSMLGAVGTTDYATTSSAGIVKINASNGITISNGEIKINAADSSIKAGTNVYFPIVPAYQHKSIYYGLSKLAGQDLAAETVTVGTYPAASKAAIQSLIGVETSVSLKETVSSTTPSITGVPNTIYECGELSTLTITPPANGTIDVYFTSGSTATVLTVPNTVKFPVWFDATTLETNTIYEIMITNGVYGSVMTWAAT